MPPGVLEDSLEEGDKGGGGSSVLGACMDAEDSAEPREALKACAPLLKQQTPIAVESPNCHSGHDLFVRRPITPAPFTCWQLRPYSRSIFMAW